MNDELTQQLIEALHAHTRAVVALTSKLENLPLGGGAGGVLTSVGKKRGALEAIGLEVIALSKQYPTEYGWFKAKLGHGREGIWFETKSKSMGTLLEHAKEAGWFLDITYDKKVKGDFTNHYIETAVKVDGPARVEDPAPEPEPKEESPW